MEQRSKWKLTARFGPYVYLNLRMNWSDLGILGINIFLLTLLSSMNLLPGEPEYIVQWMEGTLIGYLATDMLVLFPRVYSEHLYQRKGYLLWSLPVSPFETAVAKIAVGSFLSSLLLLMNGYLAYASIHSSTEKANYVNQLLLSIGFTEQNLSMEAVMGVLAVMVFMPAFAAIGLFGFSAGNHVFKHGRRLWKYIMGVLFTSLLTIVYTAVIAGVWILPVLSTIIKLAVILMYNVGGLLLFVRLSVHALEQWYSI